MRHEYVGDVGDFGKYALLRAMAANDLSLGVVWYLNICSESNNDGSFTNYESLRSCSPDLYDKLLTSRTLSRSLEAVERSAVLPEKTLFYREPVPYSEKPCFSAAARAHETTRRQAWLRGAFCTLDAADVVFLDPDNGLAGTKIKPYSRKSPKYVFHDEVNHWLDHGKSVVLYQHQQRRRLEQHAQEQLEKLRGGGSSGWALTFHRMAVRIYFVLPAKEHKEKLMERTKSFLDTEWGRSSIFVLQQVALSKCASVAMHSRTSDVSPAQPLSLILRLGVSHRLPLHVGWTVCSPALQSMNVIHDVAGATSTSLSG
jgi:hypothetical protein